MIYAKRVGTLQLWQLAKSDLARMQQFILDIGVQKP